MNQDQISMKLAEREYTSLITCRKNKANGSSCVGCDERKQCQKVAEEFNREGNPAAFISTSHNIFAPRRIGGR